MKKRENYLTWDEYFMNIAKLSAMRSKDPNTQVGACIVDNNNRILSIGYNGTPNNFEDDAFPWAREGKPLNTKYLYVCHAELNAVANFPGEKSGLMGSKLYVTLFPCNECAKLIIQSGIKQVFYELDKYATMDGTIAAKRMFDECGVKYNQIQLKKEITINQKVEI